MPAQPKFTPAKPVNPPAKWSISGPEFTGPREDVVAKIEALQSVPDEFAVAAVTAINAMDKSVRGVRLSLHFNSNGREFHLNGHCAAIF